jgi:hypothetical protein
LATYAFVPSGEKATEYGVVPTVTVAVTALVDVLITDTEPAPELATYAFVPSGEKATEYGVVPTVTVAVTALVDVLITDTELPLRLPT